MFSCCLPIQNNSDGDMPPVDEAEARRRRDLLERVDIEWGPRAAARMEAAWHQADVDKRDGADSTDPDEVVLDEVQRDDLQKWKLEWGPSLAARMESYLRWEAAKKAVANEEEEQKRNR